MLAGRDRRAGSLEAVREGPAAGLSSACRRHLRGLHTAVSLRVCLHMALFLGTPVLFSMGHKRPRAWGTVTCGINQGSRATSCPWGPLAGSAPGPHPHYCCGRSSHPGKTFGPPASLQQQSSCRLHPGAWGRSPRRPAGPYQALHVLEPCVNACYLRPRAIPSTSLSFARGCRGWKTWCVHTCGCVYMYVHMCAYVCTWVCWEGVQGLEVVMGKSACGTLPSLLALS